MKNIVLSGYFGFNNAGDEAILASMVESLRVEMPGVHITVLSNNPEKTNKQYGVDAVNRWRLELIMPLLRHCDLFISGGGSLLQDVTGAKSILYYLGLIRLARGLKIPVMFYAQGIGPVKRPWARRILGRVANKVDLITVRDEASRNDLVAMGVTRPPIYVTADPVLGWERTSEENSFNALARTGVNIDRCVGVSIRNWEGLHPEEMAAACDFLVEKGFEVLFLPFHFPGDISICREVAKLMKQESYILKENLTPGEMMDIVGMMQLVIAMRLHALIMAAAQGVPCVAISYDPKIERFADQVRQSRVCSVGSMTGKELINQLEQIMQNYSQIKRSLQEATRDLKKKAWQNAKLARELVAGV